MSAPGMWDGLNRAVIDAFAESEPVRFIVGASEAAAAAVFIEGYSGANVGRQQTQQADHELQLVQSDLPAGVFEGGKVIVRGVAYTITEISVDEGLARLLLARHRA